MTINKRCLIWYKHLRCCSCIPKERRTECGKIWMQCLKSWDIVQAFGSPGVNKGLVNRLLSNPKWVRNVSRLTDDEIEKAEEDACETVKAVLLIHGHQQAPISIREAHGWDGKQLPAGHRPVSSQYLQEGNTHPMELPSCKVNYTLQTKPQWHRSGVQLTRRQRRQPTL